MPAPKGNAHAKGNKGGGRPSEYRDSYARIAHSLCLLGATDAEIGTALGVCETTINAWKLAHLEFSEALKNGKMIADATVAEKLFKRATGYEHLAVKISANPNGDEHVTEYVERYPPDTTACIFWLKNRQRDKWRDRQDIEQNITLSPAEALKELDES